jgi:hypothetical protein
MGGLMLVAFIFLLCVIFASTERSRGGPRHDPRSCSCRLCNPTSKKRARRGWH